MERGAVLEWSDQRKKVEEGIIGRQEGLKDRRNKLEIQLGDLEWSLGDSIKKLDTKLSILANDIPSTKADVKLLQQS